MNDSTPHDFDLTLARLVDGELSGTAYREFVGALDTQPEGWRRCALAFLEEQALRRELRQEMAEPAVELAAAPAAAATHPSRFGWLALAAAVLVAFTLGALLRGGLPGPGKQTGLPIAAAPQSDQQHNDQQPTPQLAEENTPPVAAPAAELAADSDPALTVVVGEGDEQQSFRLPVSEAATVDDDWYEQQQWALTSQAQQELADQGYQSTSRQSFVPIDLGDGRQMILPVEEVMIQPVAYQ